MKRGRPKKEQKTVSPLNLFPQPAVNIDRDPDQKRPCVACTYNLRIRIGGDPANIQCRCEIDWHYIGYVECFEESCEHWKRE